jgi:hypothetical protein
MEALNDVVRAGKARYIGASAIWAWQFQKALHVAERNGWTRFVSMQDHYNLIYRERRREMLPLCREEKIGSIPYSPLASGRLTRELSSESTLRSETDQIQKAKYDVSTERDRPSWNVSQKSPKSVEHPALISRSPGCCKKNGHSAHHRGNEAHPSGRSGRRSIRQTKSGRYCISGGAVRATSHRRSSVTMHDGEGSPHLVVDAAAVIPVKWNGKPALYK